MCLEVPGANGQGETKEECLGKEDTNGDDVPDAGVAIQISGSSEKETVLSWNDEGGLVVNAFVKRREFHPVFGSQAR